MYWIQLITPFKVNKNNKVFLHFCTLYKFIPINYPHFADASSLNGWNLTSHSYISLPDMLVTNKNMYNRSVMSIWYLVMTDNGNLLIWSGRLFSLLWFIFKNGLRALSIQAVKLFIGFEEYVEFLTSLATQ